MSDTLRRRGSAVALIVAPGLALAGHLIQATPVEHDTNSELAAIAAETGRAEASVLVGFLALVLMVPAILGLARPLWSRRPRLALVGASMSVSGVLGLTALMGSAPVTVAMVGRDLDRNQMVVLTDRYESSFVVGVWVVLLLVGYSLGPIVLAVGLWRSGWSWLIPTALVLGLVLMMADAGRLPLAAGFVATWLGCALAGVGLWTGDGRSPGASTRSARPSRHGVGSAA